MPKSKDPHETPITTSEEEERELPEVSRVANEVGVERVIDSTTTLISTMIITEHAKRHSTVYQIQCETQNKGKRVASSKRRIRWRFGFANVDALQQGKQGKDCRGAEHEVVFVWSLQSGKQLILADGHEVHWAKSGRKELNVSWDMHGNHKLTVEAKSQKQFDLMIDGISFQDLPSIYELGSTTADLSKRKLRESSRSHSMPDLQHLAVATPPPKVVMQQQHSPSSSMDMIVFDQENVVEVQFQQPPQYQRSQSEYYAAPTPPSMHQYQRSQSANFAQQQPVYTWNDTTTPTQQHYRHGWQPQGYSTPQKRGSLGSQASASSNNPFEALGGYATPTTTNYDSDLNDSPLSSALRSLGVELDQQLPSLDDRSVTSVQSNPFDFARQPSLQTNTYLPNLMVPSPVQQSR